MESLSLLSGVQSRLFTVEELLESQHAKQEQLTNEMLSFSNDVICELRLLSLVRSKIIDSAPLDVYKFIQSQTLRGLSFSALEYCPSFFESNVLNHYMTFISFMRTNPSILSRSLFHFSKANAAQTGQAAYSVFLTLFQQGWCVEEDSLLLETLSEFADYQFEMEAGGPEKNGGEVQRPSGLVVRDPLTSPQTVLAQMEPLASYVTAYMFNGASFAYLQSALSQIVSILHSLSSLRDLHNKFVTIPESNVCAPLEYWRTICAHAKYCFNSLMNCMELLPPGVPALFNHIRAHSDGENKCILLFFESFVNRALDNPAVLGLIAWHPDASEWSPSKDISYVFRAKYSSALPSRFFDPLASVLELIPEFNELDFHAFLDVLCNVEKQHTILISEKELLSTNPNFPKELVITGKDICLLHEAALTIPEKFQNEQFKRTVARLGTMPDYNELALEHFRIVLQRQKEITSAAKLVKYPSLFSMSNVEIKPPMKDPYAEYFCDIIAIMPSFADFNKFLRPEDSMTFLTQMRILTPHFITEKDLLQADAVLFYSITNSGPIENLLPRVNAVTEMRYTRAMEAADRTSALNTQHQRISEALAIIRIMRENVQSHLLFVVSTTLIHDSLSRSFQTAMSKSYNFIKDLNAFNSSSISIMEVTAKLTAKLGMKQNHIAQISRILFFKMTDHVTFQQFETQDELIWKRSVIISSIVKSNKAAIVSQVISGWKNEFELRKKYLERAADLLGHIRPSSGVSVLLYYVNEFVSMVRELTKQCRALPLEQCILWVMVNTKAHHPYGINKFINHFLLGNSFVDTLLTAKEIQHLGVFSSAVCMLLRACEPYDKRISPDWD